MNVLALLLILALFTEALVSLLTQSEIFSFISDWAKSGDSFGQRLLSCGYCLSVWVSAVVTLPAAISLNYSVIFGFILVLAVHRMSNWFHHVFELLNQGALWLKEYNERQGTDF